MKTIHISEAIEEAMPELKKKRKKSWKEGLTFSGEVL